MSIASSLKLQKDIEKLLRKNGFKNVIVKIIPLLNNKGQRIGLDISYKIIINNSELKKYKE